MKKKELENEEKIESSEEPKEEVKEPVIEEEDNEGFVLREDGVKDPVLNRNEVKEENFEYDSDPLKHIEDERKLFLGKYKKQNMLKWVVSLIALAGVITTWIVIPNVANGQSWAMPVMISVIVTLLALLILYTLWVRRSLNSKMRAYFNVFYEESNKFVFDQEGFDKLEPQTPDKISKEQFTDNGMYKDIIEVGSRGLTAVEYHNIPFMVCDCAGQVKTEKRIAPVFVGKYLFAASNYDDDDPIIVYLKGDVRSLPPTDIDDKKQVHNDNKVIIWSNNSKWEKTVNAAFKKLLTQIHLSNDLVDFAISITKGRVFVCMGYDDPLMVLPLEKPYNPNPVKTYKKDILAAVRIIEFLNK